MDGTSRVLLLLSIKLSLELRVTFYNQSNLIFICFPNMVMVPGVFVHICMCVYLRKRVRVSSRGKEKEKGIQEWGVGGGGLAGCH